MNPKILFTTTTTPSQRILGFAATDQMSFRLTRGQELFVLRQHTHSSPLHLLAQNIDGASVVLENPALDDFRRELAHGYDVVAIGFESVNVERLFEMATLVRRHAPETKIIVGGYGALCMPQMLEEGRWEGLLDGVCHGEGISYLRRLLGQAPTRDVKSRLPKEGSSLPWLSPRPIGTMGIILSGLGCTQRCPFCATSASTGGTYVEVMNARQIAAAMQVYWDHSPFTNAVSIYDENFLDQRDKVLELGRLLQADERHGLRDYNYSAFGSLKAVARYDAEELLLTGLDQLWVGVESKFSALEKTQQRTAADIFPFLHSIGIKTIGSWIIGQNHQSPANIAEDLDYFVSLEPTFAQLSVLGVFPGTALWATEKKAGRLPAKVPWGEFHLYGENFVAKNFTHTEMLEVLDGGYRRLYREQGPWLTKTLEANLNGYEFCRRARHPLLQTARAEFFRKRSQSYVPLLKTALAMAETDRARSRLVNLMRRYGEIFGQATPGEEKLADAILKKAEEEVQRRRLSPGPEAREEPLRRYTYAAAAERVAGKPYSVEYPKSAAASRHGANTHKEDSDAVATP